MTYKYNYWSKFCFTLVLIVVTCLTCCVHSMTLSELENVRKTLLTNVVDIPDEAAGWMYAHGENAVPLIVSGGTTAIVVASTFSSDPSSGRVVAFGHNSYGHTSFLDTSLGQLLINCAKWTSRNKSNVKYMLHGTGGESFYNQIPGFTLNSTFHSAFDPETKPLNSVDLLIIDLNSIDKVTVVMKSMMDEYLTRGGGIIAISTAWAHNLQGRQFPGNVFFSKMGISFYTDYYAGVPYLSSLTIPISELNPYYKLISMENTYKPNNASTISTIDNRMLENSFGEIIGTVQTPFDPNEYTTFSRCKDTYQKICGSVTGYNFPLSKEKEIQKFCINLVHIFNKYDLLKHLKRSNPQVLASEFFPGLPSNGLNSDTAPYETFTQTITTIRTGWQCTGFYAIPGATLTISVSDPSKISNVRIGGHTDGIAHHETWDRWPYISKDYSISTETNSTSLFSYSGGVIYFDVRAVPASFWFTIYGQVVRTPFFRSDIHTDKDWKDTIRYYPGPWVEVESENFIVNVQATDFARKLDVMSPVTDYWGKVVGLYYELLSQPPRDYKERMQADIQISAGYMHSGYPFMTFLDQNEDAITHVLPAGVPRPAGTPGRWGHYHELGHNFQDWRWTYDESWELTCNIFSLYMEENFPDNENAYSQYMNPPRGLEGGTRDLFNITIPYKGDWSNAGLMFYLDLAQAFGWVAFKKTFATYSDGVQPANDEEIRDIWVTRFSRNVQRDLSEFCNAWSFPISNLAKLQMKNYTRWMPNDYIVGCKQAPFSESPCASLTIQNTKKSELTMYQVKIVTWAPIRHFYGERLIFTFSGESIPSMPNGTLVITPFKGITSLNSTAHVENLVGAIRLTIYPVEYLKSGQAIYFSFQAKNSANIGSFKTRIKVLDQNDQIINIVERPLEFENTITLAPKVVETSQSMRISDSSIVSNSTSGILTFIMILLFSLY